MSKGQHDYVRYRRVRGRIDGKPVFKEAWKAMQPPTPVRNEKKQRKNMFIDPGPLAYAIIEIR